MAIKFIPTRKLTTLILLLAVITAVLGCARQQPKEPAALNNNGQKAEEKNQEETANMTEEIDTSDWLTYRNEEYGFEVRYPEGWMPVRTIGETVVGFRPKSMEVMNDSWTAVYIEVFQNENYLTIEEFYQKESRRNLFHESNSQVNLVVNGNQAVQFNQVYGPIPNIVLTVVFQNKIYEISRHDETYDLSLDKKDQGIAELIQKSIVPF